MLALHFLRSPERGNFLGHKGAADHLNQRAELSYRGARLYQERQDLSATNLRLMVSSNVLQAMLRCLVPSWL